MRGWCSDNSAVGEASIILRTGEMYVERLKPAPSCVNHKVVSTKQLRGAGGQDLSQLQTRDEGNEDIAAEGWVAFPRCGDTLAAWVKLGNVTGLGF